MRIVSIVFFAALAVGACEFAEQKKVDNSIFLHDRSSKVWLVDKKLNGEKDYTPFRFEYKELVVFHQSGYAYFYKIQTFGKEHGYRMSFDLNENRDSLKLRNNKMTRVFKIKSLGRKRLVIESTAKNYPYTLVLIPFPEY